jgi:ABC-type microcin C transport system duplicated ATPase subunit YejF
MVMDSGTIVESGQLSEVFASPSSQAAKDLLEAERKLNSNPNALS